MSEKKKETTGLITVSPTKFNLSANQAQVVKAAFDPMLQKMVDLEVEYNILVAKPITPELIKEAHTLLQKYVKVRTGTAAIHAEQKKYYLQAGRFVDAWKTAQLTAGADVEEKLKEIKNHFINIEKEKIRKLGEERTTQLVEIDPEATVPSGIRTMAEDEWDVYLTGVQETVRRHKKAVAQAEHGRIAAEKKAVDDKKAADKKAAADRKRLAKLAKDAQDKAARDRARVDKLRPYMVLLRDGDLKKYQDMSDKEFAKVLGMLNKEAEVSRKHEAEKRAARRTRDTKRERIIQKHAKRIHNLPAMYECTDEVFNQTITRFEQLDKKDAEAADIARKEEEKRAQQEKRNARDQSRTTAFKLHGKPTQGLLDAPDSVFEARLDEFNKAKFKKDELEKARVAEQHHKDLRSGLDIVTDVIKQIHIELCSVKECGTEVTGGLVDTESMEQWIGELQKYVDMKRKED